MALKIKANFSISDFDKVIRQEIKKMEKAIIARLIKVGETFVKNARINGQYQNHTNNLRSSIAFAVVYNGQILHDDYKQVGDGSDGVNQARRLISELMLTNQRGYCLICVAGMEYAALVESKGRDVVTASTIMAKNELIAAFKQVA